MSIRFVALTGLIVLASGCVEERVVHDRPRPVVREVIVERPVQREYVEVVAPQPPPVRIVEVEPQPRPGYIWSRGHWYWNGNAYVAVPGHWEVVRPGYRYVHPHWDRGNDGWHFRVGAWISG
ncbi:hypothetical protein DVJ77_11250 [Dyella tabacisoli]|uniref:YXWGXW repeat-containing protein n=1 Tax=Dyella tabacisoli TaxID=2282381 RepID=A0A369UN17_9GAMM|nr:hypothetical protein DVJ77_11250 [Dyella tabacisoli]